MFIKLTKPTTILKKMLLLFNIRILNCIILFSECWWQLQYFVTNQSQISIIMSVILCWLAE